MKHEVQYLPKWLIKSALILGYVGLLPFGSILILSIESGSLIGLGVGAFLTFVSLYIIRMGYKDDKRFYEVKYVYRDSVRFEPSEKAQSYMELERSEYVYLIQDISVTGYCKIGHTVEPAVRLKHFTVKLPMDIRVIHIIECDDRANLERILHRTFKRKRVSGEWFNLDADDVEMIKNIN